MLKCNGNGQQMPLMDFYLYPPKYLSSAAIATLAPPPDRRPWEADLYRTSSPQLAGEKQARSHRDTLDGQSSSAATASPR